MAKKKSPKGKAPKRRGPAKSPAKDLPPIPDRRTLEAMFRQALGGLVGPADDSPLGRAQEFLDRAYEADSAAERAGLARQALEACPDCADAYVILAEQSRSPKEAAALFEQGVAAGARAIGERVFAEDAGHFWHLFETRPYMRARFGLAQALWAMGRRDHAIEHFQELLRLNPGDNQGVRYSLASALLDLGRDDDLDRLLGQYEDEATAVWAYSRALLAFRRGGADDRAKALLAAARKINKHVPAYLLGEKPLPISLPEYIGIGDVNEAVAYAAESLGRWKDTPGAIAWLRGSSKRPKRPPKAALVHGPLPIVKERLKRLPQQKGDEWQADFLAMPTWVEVGGELERPWIVLVMSRTESLVLGQEILPTPPGPDWLWDRLARAMEAPLMGEPHRPGRLMVRPGGPWDDLVGPLAEIGIELVRSKRLDVLDGAFASLSEHLTGGETFPGLLDDSDVSPEQAGRFYEAAAEFFRKAPWRVVPGEPTLKVESVREPGRPRYAVIMGQMGLTRGLALYDDIETLQRLRSGDLSDEENARATVAMSVTFGEKTETPIPDLDAIERHGWAVAGPDAYPSAMRKERGMVMRPPTAVELEWLEACLRAIPGFAAHREPDDPAVEAVRVLIAGGELGLRLSWVPEEDI